MPPCELAYIGPGAGFAFLGSFLTLALSLLAGVASLLLWPVRMAWLLARRKAGFGKAQVKRAIFLGLDGLDPNLTERYMAEGKLPNLSRLREQGTYRRLRTTFPPLSPVAWSTFATGVNPAKHNIFDFLNRDLRTYAPELSSAKVTAGKGWFGRPTVELRQKSEPFWKILGRHAIGSTILRVPITFPPEPFKGRMLSAMSTPDLRGTQGTFSWFTCGEETDRVEGGNRYKLRATDGGWEGLARGPGEETVPFRVVDGQLEVQGETYALTPGEYTPWVRLRFARARGIARFLLTETKGGPSLYMTPVEIDPETPALPISHPRFYAIYLAKLLGSFATLGMAEDTWAFNEGAIDDDGFLKQARAIQAEREAMFFSAVERTRRGVVACVFDTTDRVQHMFFHHLDPGRGQKRDPRYAGVIEDLYRDMDRVVGQTMAQVDSGTALFVLSDHGFCSFRRGVNLNSWLMDHGYLHLEAGLTESGEYFEGIDWSRTRAYTFGLSGLYLNLRGREAQGIVGPDEAAGLRRELVGRLTGLRDEELGDTAILRVYESSAIYRGPYLDAAPDLIVGYAAGYRASWSAAVGRATAAVFEDNTKAWSGDHCVDPALVPGVLFCNRKLDGDDPGIEDMAPTALRLFGIEPPKWMEGKPLVAGA